MPLGISNPLRRAWQRATDVLWHRSPALALSLQNVRNNTVLEDPDFLAVYAQLRRDRAALLTVREVRNLWTFGRMALSVPGDFAEVGVFRGGGAKVLRRVCGDRTLHLFDTFSGMPETDAERDTHVRAGDFSATSLESVQRYVGTDRTRYYPGFFPATTSGHEEALSRFAFVHLDVDIYQSTLDGLRFFYPRLSPGGMLMTHDFNALSCPGVPQAYEEFFKDKPERVIPLWDSQALVVKQ